MQAAGQAAGRAGLASCLRPGAAGGLRLMHLAAGRRFHAAEATTLVGSAGHLDVELVPLIIAANDCANVLLALQSHESIPLGLPDQRCHEYV